jgi:hypothetical protein
MILILVAAAAAQPQNLPAFMTGCWNLVEGDHWTQECWMEPKAGLMLGASREGRGDRFKAKNISKTAAEFTNAAHDYPQRIRYELKGDRLEAEISLIDGSKSVHWTYIREPK